MNGSGCKNESVVRHADQLHRDGWTILASVYTSAEMAELAAECARRLGGQATGAIARGGRVVAARNVLDDWPECGELWRRPRVEEVMRAALGAEFGLVRGLFFDKPPGRSWALPWHQDRTIAVERHVEPPGDGPSPFTNPTSKSGVPHVTAPLELLRQMLTVRIHLDDVDDGNGPLRVIAGTHTRLLSDDQLGQVNPPPGAGETAVKTPQTLHCRAGDVLLMRPLVVHSSGHYCDNTSRHRRILHLEFSARAELDAGYRWRHFLETRRATH